MVVETLEADDLCDRPLNASCSPVSSASQPVLIKMLLFCITLLTVMLNLLVIISISHFRQLHTPTNLILLSLAVSDLLVGLVTMPAAIISLHFCGYVGKITCAFSSLFSFTITSTSVGSMVLISGDRYVAICDPLRYVSIITTGRVKICVSLCWFGSVVYNIIILKDHLSQVHLSSSCHKRCAIVINYVSGAVDLFMTFFGPITVIILLYTRVFVVAVSHARVMRSQISTVRSNTVTVKKLRRKEMLAARTLGITLLVFIVCLSPYYSPSMTGQDTTGSTSSAQLWLLLCNSTFNPLIYAFFFPWFRKTVKVIVSLEILQPGSHKAKIT